MSDEVLNIRVTQRELDLIMDLLHEAGNRTDADGQPAFELCHDLMEQSGGSVDELEPTDLDGRTFSVAESDFIDHGIRAREMQKHSSMAANRRTMRFGEFTVDASDERSDQQNVDVWERPNDPTKW
tara:strand:- start:11078 stop:11455 length:378 start_codon:yes stop_codon:yes gene_type:complete